MYIYTSLLNLCKMHWDSIKLRAIILCKNPPIFPFPFICIWNKNKIVHKIVVVSVILSWTFIFLIAYFKYIRPKSVLKTIKIIFKKNLFFSVFLGYSLAISICSSNWILPLNLVSHLQFRQIFKLRRKNR